MSNSEDPITRKSWDEFRDSRLLWWVNRSLHLFGWSIVMEFDNKGKVNDVYPARVKFRGFDPDIESAGFSGLTQHLQDSMRELVQEAVVDEGEDRLGTGYLLYEETIDDGSGSVIERLHGLRVGTYEAAAAVLLNNRRYSGIDCYDGKDWHHDVKGPVPTMGDY